MDLVIKKSLENANFTVDMSNTGESGEEKAYVNSYDAILLDLNLPDKDAFEILGMSKGKLLFIR